MKNCIYLDGAANTPLDRKVFRAMKPYLKTSFVGNSMSIHDFGMRAGLAVDHARENIAKHLMVSSNEVFFTSGATEGNNWAIKSVVVDQLYCGGGKRHIICSATEHDSVLKACKQAEMMGMEVTYISPSNHKYIRIDDVEDALRPDTCLVCVMAVNNETGVDNDVFRIINHLVGTDIKILVDCTQSISYGGRCVEIGNLYRGATFLTFSAHKIYGPLGVGCLIARNVYNLHPLIIGGEQERGKRGGTSNVPGIVGMSAAIAEMHKHSYKQHFNRLLYTLWSELRRVIPGAKVNVWPSHSNIVSVNFADVYDSEKLASELAMYGVATSAGSACDSEHDEGAGVFNPSHVLVSMGLTDRDIKNTVRLSFTKYTTTKDIKKFVQIVKEMLG